MKDKALKFWESFFTIKDKLMDIDDLDDNLIDELLTNLDGYLKKYSSGVDFILSDLTSNGRELIFTANGDEDFFKDVITLVENAPVLDFWTITAFSKPEGKNAVMENDGLTLKSRDLFFLPLESDTVKDKIGLNVGIRNITDYDLFLSTAYLLCEKMIGEYDATTLIDFFDVVELPRDYDNAGFLPLDYLPDFVQWKIERMEDEKY